MANENTEATVTYRHVQGHFVQRWIDMIASENPDKIGVGKEFASKEKFAEWFLQHNPHHTWSGVACDKVSLLQGELIGKDQPLLLPAGFNFEEITTHVPCEVVKPKATLQREAVAAAAPIVSERAVNLNAPLKMAHDTRSDAFGLGIQDDRISTLTYNNMRLYLDSTWVPNERKVAARAPSPYGNGPQDPRDLVTAAAPDLVTTGIAALTGGLSRVAVVPFQIYGGETADRGHIAPQGNPRTNGDPIVDMSRQWPGTGKLNPFSQSEEEREESNIGPLMSWLENGGIREAKKIYHDGNLYPDVFGRASVTQRDKDVKSGYTDTSTHRAWDDPSAPQDLHANNYTAARIANEFIQRQIDQASEQFLTSSDPAVKRQAVQHALDLSTYQSYLVGFNGPRIVDVTKPLTDAQKQTLTTPDQIAFNKQLLIKAAAAQGITGLNTESFPATSPFDTITRQQMLAKAAPYYAHDADINESAFVDNYKYYLKTDKSPDLSTPEKRLTAASDMVQHMPGYLTLPEHGTTKLDLTKFISVAVLDPNDPTKVIGTNYNPVERGEKKPEVKLNSPVALDNGAKLLASDPELTKILMQDMPETFVRRDGWEYNLPAHFGNHSLWDKDRDSVNDKLTERGYSATTNKGLFSEPWHGQLGDTFKPEIQAQAKQEIVASAGNPAIIAKRQADLSELASVGVVRSGDWKGDLPKGALAQHLFHDLAWEDGNKTLNKLEAAINNNPSLSDAEKKSRTQALLQAVDFAKDAGQAQRLGITYNNQEAYVESQRIVSAREAGIALEGTTSTHTETAVGAVAATTAVTTIGHQRSAASGRNLILYAADGKPEVASGLLNLAADLPAAQRQRAAFSAIGWGTFDAANALVASSSTISSQDKERFKNLNHTDASKPLSADDASFTLHTLASLPIAAKGALGRAIANDDEVSQNLITALARQPALAQQLFAGLTPEQQSDLAKSAKLPANTFQTQTVTETVKVNMPTESATSARMALAANTPDAQVRAAREAAQYYISPETSPTALAELANRSPNYMTAVILKTLADHPEMAKAMDKNLNAVGARRDTSMFSFITSDIFDDNAQGRLADIIGGLVKAQNTNNLADQQKYSNELNKFMSVNPATQEGRENQLALRDFNQLALNNNGPALGATITAALQASLVNAPNPLPNLSYDSKQTIAMLTPDQLRNIATEVDASNSGALANASNTIISNNETVPGWTIPGIIVPILKPNTPGPKREPTIPGAPLNCGAGVVDVCKPTPTGSTPIISGGTPNVPASGFPTPSLPPAPTTVIAITS